MDAYTGSKVTLHSRAVNLTWGWTDCTGRRVIKSPLFHQFLPPCLSLAARPIARCTDWSDVSGSSPALTCRCHSVPSGLRPKGESWSWRGWRRPRGTSCRSSTTCWRTERCSWRTDASWCQPSAMTSCCRSEEKHLPAGITRIIMVIVKKKESNHHQNIYQAFKYWRWN